MRQLLTIAALLISVAAFSQSVISYGGTIDSTGKYSIIRQIQSPNNGGGEVQVYESRRMTKDEADYYLIELLKQIASQQTQVLTIMEQIKMPRPAEGASQTAKN